VRTRCYSDNETVVVVGGSMDGDSDLSEHPDHLRVRPAARPVLDESPAWGRGPVKNRLDQPSTLDLLARDAETARVAAAHAEEQEQVEAHAAAERRRARHESLTVDAEARRNSVMAREQELLLKAAERFSAEAKQERLLHKAVSRLQARVRGHQAKSSLKVFAQVATVIQAGARGMAARRATRPARTARRREVAAALVMQKYYRGRLVRQILRLVPVPRPSPSFSPGPGPGPSSKASPSRPHLHLHPLAGQVRNMFLVITELVVFVQAR
jgi:hypothetical protein